MTTKTTPKKAAKKPDVFIIVITTEHATYKGEGATALEAMQAVPMPELITSSTVVITHGEATKDMLFSGMQLKRILNPYNMEVLVNELAAGM